MNRKQALTVCCTLALAACSAEPPSIRVPTTPDSDDKNSIRQITARSATGWLLTIDPDGSGSVGYGSSGLDFVAFGEGTFDFAAVRDALLAQSLSEGSIRRDFAVAFVHAGETSTTARYVPNPELMKTLFEKGVASAAKSGTRVDELYAAHPPVPGDSATQGKE